MKKYVLFYSILTVAMISCDDEFSELEPTQNEVRVKTKSSVINILKNEKIIATHTLEYNYQYDSNGLITQVDLTNTRKGEYFSTYHDLSGQEYYYYNSNNQLNKMDYFQNDELLRTTSLTYGADNVVVEEDDIPSEKRWVSEYTLSTNKVVTIIIKAFHQDTVKIYTENYIWKEDDIVKIELTYNNSTSCTEIQHIATMFNPEKLIQPLYVPLSNHVEILKTTKFKEQNAEEPIVFQYESLDGNYPTKISRGPVPTMEEGTMFEIVNYYEYF